jgi:nitroreductase
MEFYDVVKARRSIRGYKNDPVPEDALKRIAEAVSLAPSACNIQPFSFRIVLNSAMRRKICGVYTAPWLAEAPAIAVVLGNADVCWKRLEGEPIIPVDIGIVMEHLVLAAAAEGLGTCWICAYDVAKMNKVLNILPPWSAYAVTPLGYANVQPDKIQRKSVDEVFKIIK